MPIAYDNSTAGGNGTTTFSHTVSSGNNRILFLMILSADNPTYTPTYNGVSMTLLDNIHEVVTNFSVYVFYLVNPASGANNVVTGSGGGSFYEAIAASYTGASQTGVPNVSLTDFKTAHTTSVTEMVTTTIDSCWVAMAAAKTAGSIPAAGTGSTLRISGDNLTSWFDSNSAVTPPGNKSMTMTGDDDSGRWIIVQFAFAPPYILLDTGVFTLSAPDSIFKKTLHVMLATGAFVLTGIAITFSNTAHLWRNANKHISNWINQNKS